MTIPAAPRPSFFTHATGKLPAWIWQPLSNAQHDARQIGIPIGVAHEGLRTFTIVDVEDWGDLFTPSPEPLSGSD